MEKNKALDHALYITIPYQVFTSKEVSAQGKLLLGEILALLKVERTFVFASNSHFGKLFNMDESTVSYHIQNLIKNNFIKTEVFKYGCDESKCPIADKENHRHIYPTGKLLNIVDTLSSPINEPYQVPSNSPIKSDLTLIYKNNNKENNNTEKNNLLPIGKEGKTSSALSDKFPNEDYNKVLEGYAKHKGIVIPSTHYPRLKHAIKLIFKGGYTVEQIIDCMEFFASHRADPDYKWMIHWKMETIEKKMPEFVAGKLKKPQIGDDLPYL